MNDIFFQTPATIKKNGITTKADGTIDIVFNTQEMGAAESAALFSLRGQFGQLAFVHQDEALKKQQVESIDAPDVIPDFNGEKSPSQRMRGVLYRLYEQNGKKGDWEVFYRTRMERFIEAVKERLA